MLAPSQIFRTQRATLATPAAEPHPTIEQLLDDVRHRNPTPAAYLELARRYERRGELRSAVTILDEALVVCAPAEDLYTKAIFVLEQGNRTDDAVRLAHRARTLFPGARWFELWERLMLPVLYTSPSHLDQSRARYAASLQELTAAWTPRIEDDPRGALAAITRHVNFYLGYQGQDDRRLQAQYGQLVHRIMAANYPDWIQPRPMTPLPPDGRIRIGYVSAHFRDHSVSKLFLGWLREHDRRRFELFSYHNGTSVDAVTHAAARASDHFRHLPGELDLMCRAMVSDDLHIAVFLDVKHKRMMAMSTLRLAPVQCLAWAYPNTSGSPNVDYFLSGDFMEPPDGDRHYTEQLVRLPGIGVCYPKPVIPRALMQQTRKDFGLSDDRIVYLCCQSSFKYLPQHDDLFPRIAKANRSAQFVFLAMNDLVAHDFEERLQRAFAAEGLTARDHCVMLPQCSPFDYWNLNLISDVFLDSLEWSGGVTTMEAVACGLPVVTLPGRFMRGRHSAGILTQLGVTDTIARDKDGYVEIAARLGLDEHWRAQIVERMAAGHPRLYDETTCVRALEDFYRTVVDERLSAR
jgi:predicted O-linked N-acetylglucosamine transferase (SPINDLY family)